MLDCRGQAGDERLVRGCHLAGRQRADHGAVARGLESNVIAGRGTDGTLYVVDAASGALAWRLPIGSNLTPNAGYVGGILYVTSDDRRIHAIDVATRSERWSFGVAGVPSAPAVVDGRVVATSLGKIVSLAGSVPPPGSNPSP